MGRLISVCISYISALILSIFFATFINANVGWFMCVSLILAVLLSVLFAVLTKKSINVNCKVEEMLLSKGSKYILNITVENKSIFPTTPIDIKILNCDGVKSKDKSIIISLLPMSKKTFEVEFDAKIAGLSKIGIENVFVTDYLGLLRMSVMEKVSGTVLGNIKVIPDISEVSSKDERILQVMQASLHADDSEDTTESSLVKYGGFPGYENREYVPGDSIKRINWKQSAKRGKLLVRIDDEVTSNSVNIVLDSVQKKELVDVNNIMTLSQYEYCLPDEVIPKISEDAMELGLGLSNILIRMNYKVNFYIKENKSFEKYSIEDEKDLENIRVNLASYKFNQEDRGERIPASEVEDGKVFIFVSPNEYKEIYAALSKSIDIKSTAIYSVIDDAKKNSKVNQSLLYNRNNINRKKNNIALLVIPFLLALFLSITVFSAYRVSWFSPWTIAQALIIVGIFAMCKYARKHKIKGFLILTVAVFTILFLASRFAFSDSPREYMQWFVSGGDVVETRPAFLAALMLIFTSFFAYVVFFYTQVTYRVSSILLLSLFPFFIYAKIVREPELIYVMAIIVLNVCAFLVNNRKDRDAGKRIVGYRDGLISVLLYALFFVLLSLAIPKNTETKYYHVFEENFLGGNTSTILPIKFTGNSDYSGNADDYNQLNNRKLYELEGNYINEPLYLKRQVFDYYDYDNNRWYADDYYSEYKTTNKVSIENKAYLNIQMLVNLLKAAEKEEPGFLAKYNMEEIAKCNFYENEISLKVMSKNFSVDFFIVPSRTTSISAHFETFVNENGAWISDNTMSKSNVYEVFYYDQYKNLEEWIENGGSNCSNEESIKMFEEMIEIFEERENSSFLKAVNAFYEEALLAEKYRKDMSKSNEEIPESVHELALEITDGLEYDWQKAEALAEYFARPEFLYDLSYDAPDDSVEYFLFEGKTGTCSDFASAYVLMARSIGLTVRYVEGFVAMDEQDLDGSVSYAVRTKSAHAYPEVYLQNYGFVVFEPTIAAVAGEEDVMENGVAGFVMAMGLRILIIFAIISLLIIIILVIVKILAPFVEEKRFMKRFSRAKEDKAVTMMYNRMVCMISKYIAKADCYTPKELTVKVRAYFDFDLRDVERAVEKASFQNKNVTLDDVNIVKDSYYSLKNAIKEYKKQ